MQNLSREIPSLESLDIEQHIVHPPFLLAQAVPVKFYLIFSVGLPGPTRLNMDKQWSFCSDMVCL